MYKMTATIDPTPKTRHTHIIFGNRHDAVILLQDGRTWQQLLWDTDSDVVTPGQWLKSTQIYPKESFLHDGLFLYSCLQVGGRKEYACHNIVSRPPYFTALAISDMHGRMGAPYFMQPKRGSSNVTVVRLYGELLRSPENPEFDLIANECSNRSYPRPEERYDTQDLTRIVHRIPMDDRHNPRDRDNRVRSRAVRIVGTKIYVSNRKLVDLRDNTFRCVSPPTDYHLPRKQVEAANIIWKAWCMCREDPAYAICKRRLRKEYNEMATEL